MTVRADVNDETRDVLAGVARICSASCALSRRR
jgi:hypothetical protein